MQWRPLLPKGGGLIHMDSVASHLFQLAHFGSFPVRQFFPSFWVPDFRGRFEALNNVFRAHHNQNV
jgi:hypothetical protein